MKRHRYRLLTAGLISGLLVAGMAEVPVQAAAPDPGSPSTGSSGLQAADEVAAAKRAASTGKRVLVQAATNEFQQVFALPSGGFQLESAVVPQRVKQADGSWADIDLNLGKDGTGWRPRMSTVDVTFSPGGDAPLVSVFKSGKRFTLSWPDSLPAPTVSGDAATYRDVYDDVDLVVRATETGFAHVLVVKSPKAAANPKVRDIRFTFGGDAEVTQRQDDVLQAAVGNEVLLRAPAPEMWDSTVSSKASSQRTGAGSAAGDKSSVVAPGDGAKVSRVGAEVRKNRLLLRPDTSLLTSGNATFPVFIDPAWSTTATRWAYATSNNSNNTDYSTARVGINPENGVRYRSYFEFPLSALAGKHIYSARVEMLLDHSWSCGDTYTHMYHTSAIVSTMRTKWAPSHKEYVAYAASHANEGGGCADSPQPDMTVNFAHSKVASVIQALTKDNSKSVTFGFCACNDDGEHESSQDRWKKWFPNKAKLIVNYNSYPGKPTSLQAAGVSCVAGKRAIIGTTSATFSAIFPDKDSGQSLTTQYEWLEVPASGSYGGTTPRRTPPAGASVPANKRSMTAAVTGLLPGKSYAFRARATDPDPYKRTSGWSDWCEFKVDIVAPNVSATVLTNPAGPGQAGRFKIQSTTETVTKFRWGWSSPPTNEVSASAEGSLKVATINVTAPRYGTNVLHVSAINTALSEGFGSAEFQVDPPSRPISRWLLETDHDVTVGKALADQQPTLGGGARDLTANEIVWKDDTRRIGAKTAFFNDSTSYLTTEAPVVDTSQSFSVAAWVRLNALGNAAVAVSQDGTTMSAFRLGYKPSENQWCFTLQEGDAASHGVKQACAQTPKVGRWTHVAGAFDITERKLVLYLDGVPVAETSVSGTWNATGRLAIGRALTAGSHADFWQGDVADVQVFDRVLVPHDFTGQRATELVSGGVDEPGIMEINLAGRWDFDGAVPCYTQDREDTCQAPDGSGFERWLAFSRGTQTGSAGGGQTLEFDGYYFAEENPEPWEQTSEYGRSARKTGVDSDGPDRLTTWQEVPVLRTDQSFTISVWARLDEFAAGNQVLVAQSGVNGPAFALGVRAQGTGDATRRNWAFSASASDTASDAPEQAWVHVQGSQALDDDDLGAWTHLVAVYDSGLAQAHLYVNGRIVATKAMSSRWSAVGALTVGAGRVTTNGVVHTVDHWIGGIDDLQVYQGAMRDAELRTVFHEQGDSVDDETPGDEGDGDGSIDDVRFDFDGDGAADILARNAQTNDLHLYATNGAGGFKSGAGGVVGASWEPFDVLLTPGDFNGDGNPDVIARRIDNGELWLYEGNGSGRFKSGARSAIGWQWGVHDMIFTPGDFTGDGIPDLIARHGENRNLYLYEGNGAGRFKAGNSVISSDWGGFDLIFSPGDFTGDGKADVIARDVRSQNLYLYEGNGVGGFKTGTGRAISTGWGEFDMLFSPGDISGDNNADIIARHAVTRNLHLFKGDGAGQVQAASGRVFGVNWTNLDLLSDAGDPSRGLVGMYGVLDGGKLTYSIIESGTGNLTRKLISESSLGFTPKAMAAMNSDTVLVTSPAGDLYRVDITSSSHSLTFGAPVRLGGGWTHDALAYDGGFLYGIRLGALRRYTVSGPKPDAASISNQVLIGEGLPLVTLTSIGSGWIMGTTSGGALRSYQVRGANDFTGYTLSPSGWAATQLTSPGGGFNYGRTGDGGLFRYLDANPYNDLGSDIRYYLNDPVDTAGWNEVLLSAHPF